MKIANIMTEDIVSVGSQCSLDEAIGLFESSQLRHLPVVDSGRLAGMLSDRDIALTTGWILAAYQQDDEGTGPNTVDQIMRTDVKTLGPEASISDASAVILDNRVGAVPVMQSGEIIGILTTTDLLRASHGADSDADWCVPDGMLVGASMTTEVCTANPEMMMEDAIDLCQEHSMRHLPILEQGALVGMISDRDLRFGLGQEIVSDIRAQEEGRMEIPRTQVSALMSADVITIGADRTLEHAAETMLEHGFSALPVVRKGELVGILTNTDILRSCS